MYLGTGITMAACSSRRRTSQGARERFISLHDPLIAEKSGPVISATPALAEMLTLGPKVGQRSTHMTQQPFTLPQLAWGPAVPVASTKASAATLLPSDSTTPARRVPLRTTSTARDCVSTLTPIDSRADLTARSMRSTS